ncbi:hypothetical protein K435DRAFT_811337 [Dendrothele bispora CBS 962.96]|uniref:Uncharacterized protein n=1 Tax=Dendrothele bispora (strain CBS 962.96) TaxID=1314807 RepID=A0A4S8KSB2_DENBC|nr:hypothetical protein K435DRAFT_811337 [Dendrothele bispora CBS 962.96]
MYAKRVYNGIVTSRIKGLYMQRVPKRLIGDQVVEMLVEKEELREGKERRKRVLKGSKTIKGDINNNNKLLRWPDDNNNHNGGNSIPVAIRIAKTGDEGRKLVFREKITQDGRVISNESFELIYVNPVVTEVMIDGIVILITFVKSVEVVAISFICLEDQSIEVITDRLFLGNVRNICVDCEILSLAGDNQALVMSDSTVEQWKQDFAILLRSCVKVIQLSLMEKVADV